MKSTRFASLALAGAAALAVPFLVTAQPSPGASGEGTQVHARFMKAHARHEGHSYQSGHSHHGAGYGMHGDRAMGGAFLRGLDLTDEQRDRIFAIRHAAEPAMRDQMKVLRGARSEFSGLALSSEYDESKVKELADRNAQAMSTMAQLRVRTMNEIYRVLTPEQQATVKERQARWSERGARGEGRGMRGEGRRGGPGMQGQPAMPRS